MKINLQQFADRPVQGFDVSVMVIGQNGPVLAGEFQELDLNINSEPEEYLTLNSKMPILLDGEVTLDGTLKRGFIDVGTVIQSSYGTSTLQPGVNFQQPRFIISANFNAPSKGLVGRYNLSNCLIASLSLTSSGGKKVVDGSQKFRAEGVQEANS